MQASLGQLESLFKAPLNPLTDGTKKSLILSRVASLQKNINRVEKIVFGLRVFSNAHELSGQGTSFLKATLESAWSISIGRFQDLKDEIIFILNVEEEIEVRASPADLGQICAALFENSIESMIRSDVSYKWLRITAHGEMGMVKVRIADAGEKISPEVALRMMDPFFTTKKIGDGPGLGLSVSQGLARKSGGILNYLPGEESTTFELILGLFEALQIPGDPPSISDDTQEKPLRVA